MRWRRWVHVIDQDGNHIDCSEKIVVNHGPYSACVYYRQTYYMVEKATSYWEELGKKHGKDRSPDACSNYNLFLWKDYLIEVKDKHGRKSFKQQSLNLTLEHPAVLPSMKEDI